PRAAEHASDERVEDSAPAVRAFGEPSREKHDGHDWEHANGKQHLVHIGVDVGGNGLGERAPDAPKQNGQKRIHEPHWESLSLGLHRSHPRRKVHAASVPFAGIKQSGETLAALPVRNPSIGGPYCNAWTRRLSTCCSCSFSSRSRFRLLNLA